MSTVPVRPMAQERRRTAGGARPPSFLSRSSLAAELDMSPSTVDEMVRRGVLPRPIKLSNGCVRWEWRAVETALASRGSAANDTTSDTILAGVRNAVQAQKERRRGAA